MLMLSTKRKNFSAMGRFFDVVGKVIFRLLHPEEVYHEMMIKIAMLTFEGAKVLYVIFDDTLLRKVYSKLMEGSEKNFCTKIGRRITSFKLLAAMISNGHISLPFFSAFLFSDELDPRAKKSRADWVKRIIEMVKKYFPGKEIIVLGDGAFGTKEFLRWCKEHKVKFEGRIRRNAVITYNGKKINICNIETLRPVGRQRARTIKTTWDGIPVYITAELRENKHENIIAYQVSNFKARPKKHVKIYGIRWTIEMFFRTLKQSFGIQDCQSVKLITQESHVAASFVIYSLVALDAKKRKLESPEAAIRAAKLTNVKNFKRYLDRLDQEYSHVFN
jgi:hypothetical protein